MTRESIVFILGILLFLAPHLGVPDMWKYYFYAAAGIILMVVGYSLRHAAFMRRIEDEDGERQTDSFVEQKLSTDASTGERESV